MHSQNLTDGKLPLWRSGRAWHGKWRAEWGAFRWFRPFSVGFHKGGYNPDEIGFHVAIPWFYLFVSRSFLRHFEERRSEVLMEDGALHFALWAADGSWSDWPRKGLHWYKRTHVYFLKERLLGRRCQVGPKGEKVDVLVPMPEGCYRAKAWQESFITTYRFGFRKVRTDWWLEIMDRGGIPHAGKGENGWDCGDDGLCGIGGKTLEEAIGNAVASVMKSRRRHGNALSQRGRPPVMANPEPSPAT